MISYTSILYLIINISQEEFSMSACEEVKSPNGSASNCTVLDFSNCRILHLPDKKYNILQTYLMGQSLTWIKLSCRTEFCEFSSNYCIPQKRFASYPKYVS